MVEFSSVMSSVLQGYRRLSIDIEAMRDMRREVQDKWKMILENLGKRLCEKFCSNDVLTGTVCHWKVWMILTGFMAEAESLLNVSASASYDRMRNAATARTLLQTLYTETSLFNRNEPPPERYLFILVSMSLKLTSSMNKSKSEGNIAAS